MAKRTKKKRKGAPKRNPFWSKNYITRPTTNRWEYRGWAIVFYPLPGTGTIQAVGFSPEIVQAYNDAYRADPRGSHNYVDYMDEGTVYVARANTQMKAGTLIATDIDYQDFLDNKTPNNQVSEDIHEIFMTAKEVAHEQFDKIGTLSRKTGKRVGGYDTDRGKDMKYMMSKVSREVEERLKKMQSNQRQYQGLHARQLDRATGQRRRLSLHDFFQDIQPSSVRGQWIERAITEARHEGDAPVALDPDQIAEIVHAEPEMKSDGTVKRTREAVIRKMIREADRANGYTPNPRSKAKKGAKKTPKKGRRTAASIIGNYMRG